MTTGHPFSTRKGRALRKCKLRSVDYLCEPCRAAGKLAKAVEVHHRVPLADGGDPFPPLDGLEALCRDHHLVASGAKPKPDIDPATGLPRSGHWWCD